MRQVEIASQFRKYIYIFVFKVFKLNNFISNGEKKLRLETGKYFLKKIFIIFFPKIKCQGHLEKDFFLNNNLLNKFIY